MPPKRKLKKEEDKLCRAFSKELAQLEAYCLVINPQSFKWWHNSNGQRAGSDDVARAIAGARDKALGVKKGVPDYTIHWRDEDNIKFVGYMEAKTPDGELTKEQEDFRAWCIREQYPFAEFRSIRQGLMILKQWGVLKAEAIA